MHKDMIKGNSKVIMRRIKQQWGAFTDEDIAEIQRFYAEQDKKLKFQCRINKQVDKTVNN